MCMAEALLRPSAELLSAPLPSHQGTWAWPGQLWVGGCRGEKAVNGPHLRRGLFCIVVSVKRGGSALHLNHPNEAIIPVSHSK